MASVESENSQESKDDEAQLLQRRARQYIAQLLQGCGFQTCKNKMCLTGRTNISSHNVRKPTSRSARAIALCLLASSRHETTLCWRREPPEDFEDMRQEGSPKDFQNLMQHLGDTNAVSVLTGFSSENLSHGKTINVDIQRAIQKERFGLDSIQKPPYLSNGSRNPEFVSDARAAKIISSALLLTASDDAFAGLTLSYDARETDFLWNAMSILRPGRQRSPSQQFETTTREHQLYYRLRQHPLAALTRTALQTFAMRTQIEEVVERATGRKRRHRFADIVAAEVHSGLESSRTPRWAVGLTATFMSMVWLSSWDGSPVLCRGTSASGVAELASELLSQPDIQQHMLVVQQSILDSATSITAQDLIDSYIEHQHVSHTRSYHILHFAPQLDADTHVRNWFRTQCLRTMRQSQARSTAADAVVAEMFSNRYQLPEALQQKADKTGRQMLVLKIRRDHVLQDAFDALYKRHVMELTRPLRVALQEYDGIAMGQDLGGVQVEFFNMVFQEVLKEECGFFTSTSPGCLAYLRPGSPQPLYMYEYIGMLLALALYNGIAVPVAFPLALYRQLLDHPTERCSDIADFWTAESASLSQILDLPVEGLELEYALSFEANGLRITMCRTEGSQPDPMQPPLPEIYVTTIDEVQREPNGHEELNGQGSGRTSSLTAPPLWNDMPMSWKPLANILTLTDANKAAYVRDYVRTLTYWSVKPQFDALKTGFCRVLPPYSVAFLHPASMQKLLEGSIEVEVDALRAGATYEGYEEHEPFIESFWEMLRSWSNERKRALIRFVTAADRLPAAGASHLTFKLYHTTSDPQNPRLPTSSTCFGTLFLPKYDSTETMERMINLALDLGEQGFGNR